MALAGWIIFIALFSVIISRGTKVALNNNNTLYGKENIETEYVYKGLFLVFVLWAVYSFLFGCREGFVDTYTYKLMAERIGSDFANMQDEELAIVEQGFNAWMILCNKISGNNTQVFIFLTTAITFACGFIFIYKNSDDVPVSIFLFITLFSFTFVNGIRQALVAVIFALFYDKWKNRTVLMILVCVLLSLFHESALLLIPLYLCINGKFFNWKIKILFAFALFSIVGYSQIEKLLDIFIAEDYTETLSLMTTGASILRVLINSIPFVLVLIKYGTQGIDDEDDAKFCNIILIDMAINICSLKSTYFARMAIYFSIFVVAFYPRLINKAFNKKNRVLAYIFFIVLYSAFYIYQAYTFESYGYLREFHLVPLR